MGVDPLTIGLIGMGAGSIIKGIGGIKDTNAQNKRIGQTNQQAMSMMQQGPSAYETSLSQLLGGRQAPAYYDPNTGAINPQSIMPGGNPGNDALLQFLRADPTRQTQAFDASQAFQQLGALDKRTQADAVNSLNANFNSGLGQRFGSAAMRQTSDLLANLGAQTGARNAGILQSSFENQQNRVMQGLGLQVQAGSALANSQNQISQLLASIAQANQQNQQWGQAFNQNNQNTFFNQQLQGLQAGFGMQNAQNDYNLRLFGIQAGLPAPTSAWNAVGNMFGDAGQIAAFAPMLRGMAGTRIPTNMPQLPSINIPQNIPIPQNPFGNGNFIPNQFLVPSLTGPQLQQQYNPFLMY